MSRSKYISILISLIFYHFSIQIYGQDDYINEFERITVENGLSQNTITDIIQDQFGFIWIGTPNGLNRYDGYSIHTYENDVQDSTSLIDNNVISLALSDEGDIIVGTNSGLSWLDRKKDKFKHYKFNETNPDGILSNYLLKIFKSKSGGFWLGTGQGLDYFDPQKEVFTHYNTPGVLTDNHVVSILEDSKGNLWVGTENGINLRRQGKTTFEHFYYDENDPNSIPGPNCRSIIEHSKGTIWVSGLGTKKGGISKYNPEENNFTCFSLVEDDPNSLINNRVWEIAEGDSGKIWIATDEGLDFFDPVTENYTHFLHNPDDDTSLSIDITKVLYKDAENRIWIGTQGGGINVFDPKNTWFGHIRASRNKEKGLVHNYISDIQEDKEGKIWIATDGGGISIYDRKSLTFSHLQHQKNNPNSLASNKVLGILDVGEGVWIGFWEKGLNYYDKKSKKFTNFLHDPNDANSIPSNNVFCFLKDSRKRIWVGTWGGLMLLGNDQKNINLKTYRNKPGDYNSLINNQVLDLCEDAEGNLWIATVHGLSKLNPETGNFINYNSNENKPDSLAIHNIQALALDLDSNLWVGTLKGLHIFDFESKKFRRYFKEDGLPNNVINSITFDDFGDAWVGTSMGLAKVSKDSYSGELGIKIFDGNDGLQSNEFNKRANLKTKSGELFLGGINGVNFFYPEKIKINKTVPSVYITNIKLANKNANVGEENSPLDTHMLFLNELTLPSIQSVITFEYLALNYTNPQKNQYAYQLVGFDDDWVMANKKREVTYTNLYPGTYTFRVKASNNDNLWNEEGKSLKLIITPPWWGTWYFRVFIFLLVVALILTFHFGRVSLLAKQKKELEFQVDKRTGEISAQNEELQVQQEELAMQNEELGTTLDKLKQTQSQLIQSEKMASLGVLTAGIAHEINNPLNFINAGITGIKKSLSNIFSVIEMYGKIKKDKYEEQLDNIEDYKQKIKYDLQLNLLMKVANDISIGADRTTQIVKGLRTFSRLDEDKTQLLDIHEGINSTLLLLQNKYKGRINIIKNYGEIPAIECYPGKLNQVFMNILTNAIQAIEGEGKVEITTQVDDHDEQPIICISIKDNGVGISKNLNGKIFEPFYTTKEVGEGVGLGLSISLGIIKDHDGEIIVNNTDSGGAEFLIKLPIK